MEEERFFEEVECPVSSAQTQKANDQIFLFLGCMEAAITRVSLVSGMAAQPCFQSKKFRTMQLSVNTERFLALLGVG